MAQCTHSWLACIVQQADPPQTRYPKQYRFATSVFPADNDDVITSPYNAVLATAQLIQHADAVFPVDNGALGESMHCQTRRCGALIRAKIRCGNNPEPRLTTT